MGSGGGCTTSTGGRVTGGNSGPARSSVQAANSPLPAIRPARKSARRESPAGLAVDGRLRSARFSGRTALKCRPRRVGASGRTGESWLIGAHWLF